MTSSQTLPFPLVSEPQTLNKKAKRKRFQRANRAERALISIVPQPREFRVFSDLFTLGWAKAQCLYLTAYSFTEKPAHVRGQNAPLNPETGMANFMKRLKRLWDRGYVSKFNPKGRYISGSEFPWYCIEDGKASGLGELHRHRRSVPDDEWERLIEEHADIRELAITTMTTLGFDADTVRRVIHNNSDIGIKFVSQEISGAAHKVLCAQLVSILWFGARARGITPAHTFADGHVNFSYEEFTEGHGSATAKAKRVIIEPDFYFDLNNDGYAIEAETGSAGRPKIEAKVANYLKLFRTHGIDGIKAPVSNPSLKSFRVIFYCQTPAHARMVLDVIAEKQPKGTGLFLVATTDDLHLGDEPQGEVWTREHFLKNLATADGTPLYTCIANRIASPVFSVVTGRAKGVAITKQLPLLHDRR